MSEAINIKIIPFSVSVFRFVSWLQLNIDIKCVMKIIVFVMDITGCYAIKHHKKNKWWKAIIPVRFQVFASKPVHFENYWKSNQIEIQKIS